VITRVERGSSADFVDAPDPQAGTATSSACAGFRHFTLVAAAFPDRVAPARFAAYRPGMTYGWHADLACPHALR
jgi:predicted 2-oxoglutarate/Fe(II)-dependent dioxygenase YbiX